MDPEFDDRHSSKKAAKSSRFPLRNVGLLMVLVALMSLAFASMARSGTRSRPFVNAPPGTIKHFAVQDPNLIPYPGTYGQNPVSVPANPSKFIVPAPQGIDERFIVTAPSGIDDHVIVSPNRAEPFINPNTVPSRVAPVVPAR